MTRCSSTFQGYASRQCVLERGHVGSHKEEFNQEWEAGLTDVVDAINNLAAAINTQGQTLERKLQELHSSIAYYIEKQNLG